MLPLNCLIVTSLIVLPDKAIDLVDQACATIRTEMGSNPTELDQVNRRVMQLEIEESALKMNLTMRANRDYKNYKKSLPMKKKQAALQSRRIRKRKNSKFTRKRAQLDESRQALEDAQTNNNLEKAAELQYGTIPQLEKNLEN